MSNARGSGSGSGTTTTAQDSSDQSPGTADPLDGSGSGSGSGPSSGSNNTKVQFGETGPFHVSEEAYPCGPVTFSIPVYVQNPNPNYAVSVNYATQDGSAIAGTDYTAESGTLNFAPGSSGPDYVNIPILDDGDDESVSSESFRVNLSNPFNAGLGTPSTVTVNIDEGPQQAATDTLRWNPCNGNNASTVTNWYDVTQGFQLQNGAMGPNPSSPIQFDANPNDTPNSNAVIKWDQNFTVASITLTQYTGQQTINSGATVESKGTDGTALSMDGNSKLALAFTDAKSVFQIDNNATITNMALAGTLGNGTFVINGGTTTIGLQSNGVPYTDAIGVQFNIAFGATLKDQSYNALTFQSNFAAINVFGTMAVAYGTGTGITLIDNDGFGNNYIKVNGGTLKYLGAGGVKDTFNVPVYVLGGGTFSLGVAPGQNNGGKLIVKDLGGYTFPNNSTESVYMTGAGSTVQLAKGDTLECDNDFYLDHGTLETTDTTTCTLQDGAQGGGTATITNGGVVWIAYSSSVIYGELDVKAGTLQFGGQLVAQIAGYDPAKQNQGQQDVLNVVGGTFNLNPQAGTTLSVGLNSPVSGDSWTIIYSGNNITSSTNTINFGTMTTLPQTNSLTGGINQDNKTQYVLKYQ